MSRILFLLLILGSLAWAEIASAEEDAVPPPSKSWTFNSPQGNFDRASLQRGFQVYKEVCAACHSLNHVRYRNLKALGFSEDQVKAIAAENTIMDGPNDEGQMVERPRRPNDFFYDPYPNEQAARAANGGGYPVDLSLITKARADGPNYLYALLTNYQNAPKNVTLFAGKYYNPHFPGQQIAMPPPLTPGLVSYSDGTQATVEQMAQDVVNFLAWAAEPELETRHAMGIKVSLFLLVWAALLYFAYRTIWGKLKL
jgi:ubiquinol-cytochrome c reductase cytochrome c1 subunit